MWGTTLEAPSPAGTISLTVLALGAFLKWGLEPQVNPGPRWSRQVCHGIPHGQSHLKAEEDRMQLGHVGWVQAVPFTRVASAASLFNLQVSRGHWCMKEVGGGEACPTPSAQAVSFISLRSIFSCRAVARTEWAGSAQGQFCGNRKALATAFSFLLFLPGRLSVSNWLCISWAATVRRQSNTCTHEMQQ